jgi:hypothetical protein
MTSEEAIKTLRANVMVACDTSDKVGYDTPLSKSIEQALEMAIKALEQEPCEDCWSKKEVADIINRQRFGIQKISMGIIKEKLEALPTVTPTRKRGKWLKSNICGAKVCSICLAHMGLSNFKYCPNCGAEMENVENDK